MKVKVYNTSGKAAGEMTLPKEIFGLVWNSDLVHQVMRVKLANKRQVLAHTKDRSEVRGGGIKPWRQKGTGRARHGSIRSPIWAGGGVTFGPTKERVFKKKINKAMNRKAILTVLSQKLIDEEIIVVENFNLKDGKTKELVEILNKLPTKTNKVLIGLYENSPNILRASNNLQKVGISLASDINLLDLLQYKYLLLMKGAIDLIKNTFVVKPKETKVKA